MALLKDLTKKIIMEEVIRCSRTSSDQGDLEWRVLVVDKHSMRVVSSCCSMHDVAAEGITIVEDINKIREPLPYMDVIYFITPTEKSIELLLSDLSSTLYKGFHIFFTAVCREKLFEDLCVSPSVNKIKSLKEINISFLPYESHVFSLDCPDFFTDFYNQSSSSRPIEKVAEQIATLCATLGEYPSIRYRRANENTAELAKITELRLKEYKENGNSMGEGVEKARSQLLILDRGYDCVTPLLHELTFQAMIHDLLNVENNVYTYPSQDGEKTVLLDDNDQIWLDLRHKHIADVSKIVPENLKRFVESKQKIQSSNKGDSKSNAKELALMMKKMPQYQKECTNLTTHITLAEGCMKQFNRIKQLCELEQNLAMGTNVEGEKIRDHMGQMNPILLDMDNENVSTSEKLRIILLYVLSKNGIAEDSLNKLIQHASIDEDLKCVVTNASYFGLNVIVNGNNRKEIAHIDRKDRSEESKFTLSRWTPVLKDILEFIIEDRLDESSFPFIPGRSAQTGYKQAISSRVGHWHDPHNKAVKKRPRLIVFVIGGVTFAEMRTVYEINTRQSDWEVVIGSNQIITASDFLDNLKTMNG